MKNLIYLFILLFTFSCQKEEAKKPNPFIDKNKMIDLIVDMKIAQKAKTVQNKHKKKNINYMTYVYDKYKIDSVQFKKNNDYYTDNLELYQEIYEKVQTRLKDSVSKYEVLKKRKDSIAKSKKKKAIKLKKSDKKKLKTPSNTFIKKKKKRSSKPKK